MRKRKYTETTALEEQKKAKVCVVLFQGICKLDDSLYQMEEPCYHTPEQLKPEHGYHRDSYQHFTKNIALNLPQIIVDFETI